jgi:hypothetical protein
MDSPVQSDLSAELERQIEFVERDAWNDMYAAASGGLRAALGLDCQQIDGGAVYVCGKIDHIQFNRVTGLGLVAPARAEALERAVAAFAVAGIKNWIVHVAPHATGLSALCKARGFAPHPRTWAKFIRGPEPFSARTDLAVRQIGAEHATAFGEVAVKGFGMSPFVAPWLAALVGRPHWRSFMAFDGDKPVAVGTVYIDEAVAWLGIGATLPSHRGRGAQGAILAARIDAAARDGCIVLTTETGIPHEGEAAPSFKNIQRAGFRVAYERPNFRRSDP